MTHTRPRIRQHLIGMVCAHAGADREAGRCPRLICTETESRQWHIWSPDVPSLDLRFDAYDGNRSVVTRLLLIAGVGAETSARR